MFTSILVLSVRSWCRMTAEKLASHIGVYLQSASRVFRAEAGELIGCINPTIFRQFRRRSLLICAVERIRGGRGGDQPERSAVSHSVLHQAQMLPCWPRG